MGASFVRADLHVHTHRDSEENPQPDFDAYVDAALVNDVRVLAITDHNSVDFVSAAINAAADKELVVIPGIEVSTRDGHVLALFDPSQVEELKSFASPEKLELKTLSATEKRSERSALSLVEDIDKRGGLAILAHVDSGKPIEERMAASELADLIASPYLAGIEFTDAGALESWFTEEDENEVRRAAWEKRSQMQALAERGLARLMSSDAHSAEDVGQDRTSRTLTRLRLDEPNFTAVRNAIKNSPKARCKAEGVLPATYPRIVGARFEGGFLDGVALDFTENLNCLIGGRGSGKSTALLAIRAAVGAPISDEEDPDEKERMPLKTTVTYIDSTGSERLAIRERNGGPRDEDGSPIQLRIADLAQGESGRLARGYRDDPLVLLGFIDEFIDRHEFTETEHDLLAELAENQAEVKRTAGVPQQIKKLSVDKARLEGSLKAAEEGKVEEIAKWARRLASHKPLLAAIEKGIDDALKAPPGQTGPDLDALASQYDVDLTSKVIAEFVEGDDGLRSELAGFAGRQSEIVDRAAKDGVDAAEGARKVLKAWQDNHADLERRLGEARKKLEGKGLAIQADAVLRISNRLNEVKKQLVGLEEKRTQHQTALKERGELLEALRNNRDSLYEARRATMKRIAAAANHYSDDLVIHISFERHGIDRDWTAWLSARFPLRKPRVGRIAAETSPAEFAAKLKSDRDSVLAMSDEGRECFAVESLEKLEEEEPEFAFGLETMLLQDRPRITVQRKGEPERRPFDQLSAGQQRSVLLGLILCAERSEPLVLDQPEDHLDGQYIASSVVRHLEAAKERRQVLIATHSANLVVLGDAELVIPLRVEEKLGRPYAVGAVDRRETTVEVCALLEGGTGAYRKRGDRYGFTFASSPPEVLEQ